MAIERVAALLAASGAEPSRLAAWRSAAQQARASRESLMLIAVHEGFAGVAAELGVARAIAVDLHEVILTGRLSAIEGQEHSSGS